MNEHLKRCREIPRYVITNNVPAKLHVIKQYVGRYWVFIVICSLTMN